MFVYSDLIKFQIDLLHKPRDSFKSITYIYLHIDIYSDAPTPTMCNFSKWNEIDFLFSFPDLESYKKKYHD